VNKEFILFTSTNFPSGGPAAAYLNLFCKGVKNNNGAIRVYLSKGYIYKGHKHNEQRKNTTDYGVKYSHLGFANRPKSIILKVTEDMLSILVSFGVMLKLIFKRKKIIIFMYSEEVFTNIPVYFFSKLFHIEIISFVPEACDNSTEINRDIFKRIKQYSLFLNYNILNKLTDKLIVFSSFLKNEYISMGYDEKNIIIQPNLTDLNGWYIPNQRIQYTIGYAGTPSKKDGIFDLISSIKILKDRGTVINAIIIGDSPGNESYLPELRGHCRKLGISDQIIFKGLVPQEQVKEYLNECQILAVTRPNTKQTQAGFPTKLGEYMACRKVVLATKFGDIEQYFSDRTDIILAEPENPVSIAENILWILNNSEKSKTIAKNGFNKANQLLNYNTGVKKITEFIN